MDKMQLFSWPVFSREVRGFLRTRKAFWCLFLFLGILLFFLLSSWSRFVGAWSPQQSRNALSTSIAGKHLFHTLAFGQIFILTILTPFLTAPAIVGEYERATLGLLISSPVRSSFILIQKLVSSMAFLVLLLAGAAPVMALCFLAGGLSGQEVAGAYAIILGASLMYGSVGLACSTFGRRLYEVYLLTFVVIFLVAVILPFHSSVWHYICEMSWESRSGVTRDWDWLSPFTALRDLLFPRIARPWSAMVPPTGFGVPFGMPTRPGPGPRALLFGRSVVLFLAVTAVVAVVCFVIARWRLRRIVEGPMPRGESAHESVNVSSVGDNVVTARGIVVKSGLFDEDQNPASLLERRVQWLGHLTTMIRLFYIALMISIVTLPLASSKGAWLFLSLPYLAAALFTVPLAATSISSDREKNTLDMLLVTLLSPAQILQAKFRTSFVSSLILALALYLPGMSVVLFFGVLGYKVDLLAYMSHLFALVCYPFLLISSLFFYTAVSLFCSVKCRRSNVALLVSSLVVLGCILLPLLCVHLLSQPSPSEWMTSDADRSTAATFLVSSWSTIPFVLISPLTIVSWLFPKGSISVAGLSLHNPLSSLHGIGFLFLVIHCVLVVYLGRWLLRRGGAVLAESGGLRLNA